ncbi:MAG: SGNH/GDSL hydrolase family protein [Ruminococcus sp.]
MKDYGNAGALCGALGCMVLLFVSMHFAKTENKPDTENVSAEIVMDQMSGSSGTSPSGDAINTSEGETAGDMSEMSGSETTAPENEPVISLEDFIGPITPEQKLKFDESIKYSPEVLHLVYPDELSIVGDSIASGFGVYDTLDNSYDFATGNLAARSITEYNFSYGGVSGTYIDALTAAQPAYIYLSMGMNDVNIITSDEFAELYRGIISDVRDSCPDSNIIVAGITPVAADSAFTANSSITMFNEKLKAVAEEFDSPNIIYYDAGSIIMDEETGGLREDCDGGDGIHLAYAAYAALIENLYPVLDKMPIPQKVKDIIDEDNLAALVTTEAETEEYEETFTETVAVEIDMNE